MMFIHAGFCRTATTAFQQRVFCRHPQIDYLGIPAPMLDLDWAIHHICNADSVYYDESRVAQVFESHSCDDPKKTRLLSYENFTNYESKDKGVMIERIYKIFPESRILFTIRRQEDMVASYYVNKLRKYLKGGHYIDFDEYFRIKDGYAHRTIIDDIHYFDIIGAWASVFSRDCIKIMLFEQLIEDRQAYCLDLAEFLQVDGATVCSLLGESRDNASMSRRYLSTLRALGTVLPRKQLKKVALRLNRTKGNPFKVGIGSEVRARVRRLCGHGNQQLQETYGVNLQRFGYALADEVSGIRGCAEMPSAAI